MMTLRTTPDLDAALDRLRGPFTRTGTINWALKSLVARYLGDPATLQKELESANVERTGGRKGGPGRGHTKPNAKPSKKPAAKQKSTRARSI